MNNDYIEEDHIMVCVSNSYYKNYRQIILTAQRYLTVNGFKFFAKDFKFIEGRKLYEQLIAGSPFEIERITDIEGGSETAVYTVSASFNNKENGTLIVM